MNTDVIGHRIIHGPTKVAKGVKSTGMILRPKRKLKSRRKKVNARKLAFLHIVAVRENEELMAEAGWDFGDANVIDT